MVVSGEPLSLGQVGPGCAGRSPGSWLKLRRREKSTTYRRLRGAYVERGGVREVERDRDPGNAASIDLVSGEEQVTAMLWRLQARAARELLYLVKHPFPPEPARPRGGTPVRDAGTEPVAMRVVYEAPATPVAGPLREAGPDVRLMPEVPIGLMVVDREIAVVPAAGGSVGDPEEVLVIDAPAVVEALATLFERVWGEAAPYPVEGTPNVGERRRRVLAMMAAGLTDDSIARALQVSRRTVQTEVTALADELGARTRFQIALLASRRGLI